MKMKLQTFSSILILAVGLFIAFQIGRCTKQNISTDKVTTVDTLYKTDTLRLPPVGRTVEVEKTIYVRDQKSLDSLHRISRRRANLFNDLATKSKQIIDEMQFVIDSLAGVGYTIGESEGVGLAIAEDYPINYYQGDTVTAQQIGVTWKIATLGELYESPELIITSPFVTSSTMQYEKAKNRAIGINLGALNIFDENKTYYLPSMHYRRGAFVIQGGPVLNTSWGLDGAQLSAGLEIGWKK